MSSFRVALIQQRGQRGVSFSHVVNLNKSSLTVHFRNFFGLKQQQKVSESISWQTHTTFQIHLCAFSIKCVINHEEWAKKADDVFCLQHYLHTSDDNNNHSWNRECLSKKSQRCFPIILFISLKGQVHNEYLYFVRYF